MSEEYARSISKQVVAQLAEREGFQLAHGNALEALADVLNRFIREIGTYAKDYAELQGRTDVNILDLADGLHDLGFTPEVLLDQAKQEHAPDPFIHSVPEFPVRRLALQPPTFKSSGDSSPAHIPAHLPAFPAPHTMKFTQMPQLRRTELQQQQQQLLLQQQKQNDQQVEADSDKAKNAQDSLITLHQRLQATSGTVRANPFLAFRDAPKASTASDGEPSTQKNADAQGVWLPDAMQAFAPTAIPEDKTARTKKLSVLSGEKDDEMDLRDSDDDRAEPSGSQPSGEASAGWSAAQVDEDILMAAPGATGASGISSFQERYSLSRKDAFVDEQLARDAVQRRGGRTAETAKKLRAFTILDTGADAILMEYPEGYVPRQGTQRGRDDVPG